MLLTNPTRARYPEIRPIATLSEPPSGSVVVVLWARLPVRCLPPSSLPGAIVRSATVIS